MQEEPRDRARERSGRRERRHKKPRHEDSGSDSLSEGGADRSDHRRSRPRDGGSSVLSAEARAIINAVNGNTDSKIGVVIERISKVETRQTTMETRMDRYDAELVRIAAASARPAAGGGTGSAGGGPASSAGDDEYNTPIARRCVVVIGGFPQDTARPDVENMLNIIFDGTIVIDKWAPYRLGSIGKVRFSSSSSMWTWIKANAGTRFTMLYRGPGSSTDGNKLWFSIDKTKAERELSKKISTIYKKVLNQARVETWDEERIKKCILPDYTRGTLHIRADTNSRPVLTIRLNPADVGALQVARRPSSRCSPWTGRRPSLKQTRSEETCPC